MRTDLYIADEAFLTGTAAEVVPIRAVDDRTVGDGRPGPVTKRIQETYFASGARPGRPVQGLARACRTLTHGPPTRRGPARPTPRRATPVDLPASLPEAVDIFDTTLRDGSQQEGLSLTVDDKLRVAEQLDHLGVAYIEGGWPGANPKDEEFFARAPAELRLSTATLVAFGSTRRAGVRAEDDEVLRQLVKANTEAVCIVAKASEVPRHRRACAPRSTRPWPWWPTPCASCATHDLRVFFDAEHFFDGYRDNPGVQPARPAGGGGGGRRDPGAVRHQRRHAALTTSSGSWRGIVDRLRVRRSACTSTTTRDAPWPTRSPPCGPGRTHVQGCVNGYGERTGNADLSAAIPNLSLKLGMRTIPPERLERLTPVSHHIAELVNIAAQPPAALRGRGRLRPQGGAAHERHRPSARRLRARPARRGRQRHALRGVGDGRTLDVGAEGGGARARARLRRAGRGARHAQGARAPRATTSRWPTGRSSC